MITPIPHQDQPRPVRYDLANKANRIGCLSILSFFAISIGAMVWLDPKASLSLLLVLPLSPIGFSVLFNMWNSLGQVLETDGTVAVLTKNEAELWRFNWADIAILRVAGTMYWELEDRAGKCYRLIVLNLPNEKSYEIRAYLPPTAEIANKRFEIVRRRNLGPSYPYAAVLFGSGTAAFSWGLFGIVEAVRSTRSGDGQIQLSLLLWQMLSFTAGIILLLAGIVEVRRNPNARHLIGVIPKTLREHLNPRSHLTLPEAPSTWEIVSGAEKEHRLHGSILLVAVIFWGSMTGAVINGVIHDPRTWGLLAMYSLIILMHVVGVVCWFREVGPVGYTIRTHETEVWVQSETQTYPARFAKFLGSPSVEFSLNGRRRFLDPKYFGSGRVKTQKKSKGDF